MREVVVTGLGVRCSAGCLGDVIRAHSAGQSCMVAPQDEFAHLPISGLGSCDVDVRPFLKRRKDRKLLPRAAHLAIPAAHDAYGEDRSPETAIFMGVGREPPENETEAALVASMTDGCLDVDKLHTLGVAVYPPLAPLKTLPNLVLAHVAIQLECMGEGGTRAGGQAAGLAAVASGYYAIAEGRSDVALAGAADSLVDAGSARDAVRTGLALAGEGLGEAAAFLRLEEGRRARSRGARILGVIQGVNLGAGEMDRWSSPLVGTVGICGVASAPLWIAVQMGRGVSGELRVGETSGAWSTVSWTAIGE